MNEVELMQLTSRSQSVKLSNSKLYASPLKATFRQYGIQINVNKYLS